MYENLISGLVSGLVVTVFVVVFRTFWKSIIVPWFEERVYKDVKIEGKWFGLYPTSIDLRRDVIVLKRHGHYVSGTLTCTKGKDEGDEYSLCGSFRNLLLPLTYESTDREKTDRGTITLRAINNGEKLSGKIAYYHNSRDSISSTNIIWFRSKDELEECSKESEAEMARLHARESQMNEVDAQIQDEAPGVDQIGGQLEKV